MKSEILTTAAVWAIGGGIGQLLVMPFGMASGQIWLGLVIGATSQAFIYCRQKTWRLKQTVGER